MTSRLDTAVIDTLSRREFLALGTTATITSLAGCNTRIPAAQNCGIKADPTDDQSYSKSTIVDVRGAIYIPSRAFTLYQMWDNYRPEIIERDLTYATTVNLNAIRTWLCYEAWLEDPDGHGRSIDHFLATAEDHGLSVLLGLFDGVGVEPTPQRLVNSNPITATGTSSPSKEILTNPGRWRPPNQFVSWFMDRYRNDDRLLGIEVMNEPGWEPYRKRFAHEMFETIRENRGSVPLTVGSTSIANNTDYVNWGSDILQFHYNYSRDRTTYRNMLQQVTVLASQLEEPVWLTEWQRTRHGRGFTADPREDEKVPDYATLAPLIHESGIGNFFWSLMVKPAWVQPQRKNGVLSGLFHEDGAVWSLEDARAIKAMSGDRAFTGEERKEWPEWAASIPNYTSTGESPRL
jgi:Cellulase (glycosyl hydrolase family 5)